MFKITQISYSKLFEVLKEQKKDDWQFALDIGTSYGMIDRIIRGKSVPTSVLLRMATALNTSLEGIMEHIDITPEKPLTMVDLINTPEYWYDLDDMAISMIRFKFIPLNEIDVVEDLEFIVGNVSDSCKDICDYIRANVSIDPEKNPYSSWVVTDRKFEPITTINRGTCHCQANPFSGSSTGYKLIYTVEDPRIFENTKED